LIEQQPETPKHTVGVEARKEHNWAPWSSHQAFYAVLFTLVPWIGFTLILNALGGNTPLTKPLSFSDDLTAAIFQIIFTALIEGAFLIAPYYYARKTRAQQTLEAGESRLRAIIQNLGLRRFDVVRALPWIIGLMALIFGVNLLYSYAITLLHLPVQTNDQVVLHTGKYAPITTYAILAGSVLIAPFCEELFFRGFLLTGLRHELTPIWAILVSAALFAIAHADPGSFIPLFAIGICLGFLRLRTGSTWANISLHMLNNLLSSVLIILAMHNINLPF